jgi:hypothetical protein
MRRFVLPTAAGLAIVAYVGLASAQPHERGGRGPEGGGTHAPGGTPGGGGAMHGSGGPSGNVHQPGGPTPRGEWSGPRGYQPDHGNRTETPAQRSQPNRRAEPERKIDENRRAEPQRNRERGAEERTRAERQREQEGNAERGRAAQPKAAEEQRRVQEREQAGGRLGERPHAIEQARTHLSMQDREKLHRSFDFERARAANVNFDHHVGRRIPRTVHLFPVPREVIDVFPDYRDYSYFVVGDEICIVDPRSYEVVDVVDQGYWPAPPRQATRLRLGSAQIALIRDSIPRDFPQADVRLRLALGGEIPDDVELYGLPQIVVDRVPELSDFRFLVADDQIVIVDPQDRYIALVIDRT